LSAHFSAAFFKAFFPVFSIVFAVLALLIIIRLVLRYIEKQKLAKLGIADIDRMVAAEATSSQSVCVLCGRPLSQKVLDYCMSNNARFKGQVYCFNCQMKI